MKKNATFNSILILILLYISFQSSVTAQAIPANNSIKSNINIEVKLTKDTSKEVMTNFVNIFNKFEVDLTFDKVKRNDDGEINSISIVLRDHKGKQIQSKIKGNKPIASQKIYLDMNKDQVSDFEIYTSVENEKRNTSKPVFLESPKIIEAIEKAKMLWVNDTKYGTQELLDKTIVYEHIKSIDGEIYITGSVLSKTEADKFFETEGLKKVNMLSYNDKGKVVLFRIDSIGFEISE